MDAFALPPCPKFRIDKELPKLEQSSIEHPNEILSNRSLTLANPPILYDRRRLMLLPQHKLSSKLIDSKARTGAKQLKFDPQRLVTRNDSELAKRQASNIVALRENAAPLQLMDR
jgi:hypothetical protein